MNVVWYGRLGWLWMTTAMSLLNVTSFFHLVEDFWRCNTLGHLIQSAVNIFSEQINPFKRQSSASARARARVCVCKISKWLVCLICICRILIMVVVVRTKKKRKKERRFLCCSVFEWGTIIIIIIIIDRFYMALFSALEQTHCARMWFYMTE